MLHQVRSSLHLAMRTLHCLPFAAWCSDTSPRKLGSCTTECEDVVDSDGYDVWSASGGRTSSSPRLSLGCLYAMLQSLDYCCRKELTAQLLRKQ